MPSPQLRYLTLLPCWRWVGTPLYPETCELRGDGPPCEYLYGLPPLWIPAMTELGGGEPPLPIDKSLGLGFCLCFSSSLSRSDPRFWDPPIPFQHWHALTAHLQEIRRIHRVHPVSNIRWTSSDIRSPALAFAFAFAGFFSSSASSSGTVSST